MPNWAEVLNQINQIHASAQHAFDIVRRQHLDQLHKKTQRNVIAYYSGFLSKSGIRGLEINDEDKNGFMMAVHQLDREKGLDLLLHTPGGGVTAAQSIVDYLHKMFGHNIRAIVPQIAMSAGTMIACSCREILMAKHSNLGPIDPHFGSLPAYGVIQEFKRALREIKKDPDAVHVWRPILAQYSPSFLSECENAIKLSGQFVQTQLETVMFKGSRGAATKARKVVRALSNYTGNAGHSKHLHFDDCQRMGLKVNLIEKMDDEMQDLILTVHHCFMHSLMNTPTFKMIENHAGVTFAKQQLSVAIPQVVHT